MSNHLKFSMISLMILIRQVRDIAQLGRVPALGAGCRRFKSYYPEHWFFLGIELKVKGLVTDQ